MSVHAFGLISTQTIEATSFENGPTTIGSTWNIPLRWENNDGVTYTEFGLAFTDPALDPLYQIANLSENITLYSNDGDDSNNLSDYLAAAQGNTLYFVLDSLGVDNKWNSVFTEVSGNTRLSVTPSGLGPEAFDSSDYALGFIQIDQSDLHGYSIVLSENPDDAENLAFAISGASTISSDGFGYQVVPEPTQFGLILGLIGLGLVSTRRKLIRTSRDSQRLG